MPQKDRQALVNRFREDPNCRLFITTNAGSTGLNLQAANTVINVDLPWNPAVLEQRIARAHRMGQQQPVQVYVLVTEGTIEEGLLNTLSAKRDLAMAGARSRFGRHAGRSGDRRRRIAAAAGGAAGRASGGPRRREPEGRSRGRDAADWPSAASAWRRPAARCWGPSSISSASWWPRTPPSRPPRALSAQVRDRLGECVEEDASGRPRLTVTLPDRSALDSLAQTLARLMLAGGDGSGAK